MSNLALVYNKEYSETVTQNFKKFLDSDLYIDLVFVCRNNQKVGAHQIVMGCISKLFYGMFLENVNTVKEKVVHVYVPDIRAKIMKRILDFVYCGKALLSKTELTEFNEDIKLLGMPLDVFTSSNEASTPEKNAVNTLNSTNTLPVSSKAESNESSEPSSVAPTSLIVPTSAITNNRSESIISSSNSSVPVFAPSQDLSSSAIINRIPTPGMPVIVNAQTKSNDWYPNNVANIDSAHSNPGISRNKNVDSNHSKVDLLGSKNVNLTHSNAHQLRNNSTNTVQHTQNVSNQSASNSGSTAAASRKRRKINTTGCAVIDLIDDEENDDVITLS